MVVVRGTPTVSNLSLHARKPAQVKAEVGNHFQTGGQVGVPEYKTNFMCRTHLDQRTLEATGDRRSLSVLDSQAIHLAPANRIPALVKGDH